jgi:glycine/D-amino acid oxidase-like deaminating enzyme
MAGTVQSDVLVIGGGLAGLVTALECLRAGSA